MHTGIVATRPFALLRTALLLPLLVMPILPAAAQQAKCLAGKTSCMAKKAAGLLKCEALAETPGKPADPNDKECVTKARTKFDGGLEATKGCFEKLENKNPNDCLTLDDTGAAETAVDACVAALVAAIDPPPLDQTKCGAGKKKCASKYLAGLLKCRKAAQTPGKPTDPNTKGCIDKAVAKYSGGVDPARGCFAKLEAKNPNDCQSTSTSLTVQGLAENCVDDLVAVVAGSASTTSTTIAPRCHHDHYDHTSVRRQPRRDGVRRREPLYHQRHLRERNLRRRSRVWRYVHGVPHELRPRYRTVHVRHCAGRDGLRRRRDARRVSPARHLSARRLHGHRAVGRVALRRHAGWRFMPPARHLSERPLRGARSGAGLHPLQQRRQPMHPERHLSGRRVHWSAEELR